MLIVQSRVESPQLAEARARVCSPIGRARNYLVSRVPWLMTSPWQSAPAPTTTALCAASAMSPYFPFRLAIFDFCQQYTAQINGDCPISMIGARK
jgi:hypothetical protein